MGWLKLDDKCPRHPKIAGLSDRAFRWWIHALCYASEFLTDGVLPSSFIRTVPKSCTRELLQSGLWHELPGSVVIHDYLIHQTSRADVEKERERNRQRRTGGAPSVDQRYDQRLTGGKPRPEEEDRIQTQNTDPPAQDAGGSRVRGGSIVSPAEFERLQRFNAYVGGRLRVPHKLHGDFRALLGGADPDAALRAWYADLDAELERTGEAIVPDVWKYLEARFKPWAANQATDAVLDAWAKGRQ